MRAANSRIHNLEVWKTDCPELSLQNNDLFIDAAGSSGGWGDPLDREPQLVVDDLNQKGVSTEYQFLSDMHGVVARQNGHGTWELDKEATLKKNGASSTTFKRIANSGRVVED